MQTGPLWPKYQDVKSQIQKIIKLNPSQKHNLLTDENYLHQIIGYYQNPTLANQNTICAAGVNNFIIDRKGDVRLCFDMPPIGNILKDSAPKIWHSQKAQQQRKTIRKCQKLCKTTAGNKVDINRQIKAESQNYIF